MNLKSKPIIFLICFMINILKISGAKKDSVITTRCSNFCETLNYCVSLERGRNGGGGISFSIYPPKERIGKCFCRESGENYQFYKECVQCVDNGSLNNIPLIVGKCDAILLDNTIEDLDPQGVANPKTGNITVITTTSIASTNLTPLPTSNVVDNNMNTENNESEESSGITKYIALGVIACVAVVGVAGFVVYNRKRKARPESMPFYGGSASSPNHFATLNTPKSNNQYNTINKNEINSISQNPTLSYTNSNTQYYDNAKTETNYSSNYNYDQNQQAYDGYNQGNDYQYDQNNYQYGQEAEQYQGYDNENLVAGAAATGVSAYNNSIDTSQRRESMMPGNNGNEIAPNNIIYICNYKYEPKLDDELELRENDQVQIIEEYEDGWMKAINITTGLQGMAPRVCIKEQ